MVGNKFLKEDIENMIKIPCQSIGYIRGYMTACYHLNQITKETFLELKRCLAANLDNIIRKDKFDSGKYKQMWEELEKNTTSNGLLHMNGEDFRNLRKWIKDKYFPEEAK